MTHYHLMFLLVELYVTKLMLSKKYSTKSILDFRHLVFNYIHNTDGLSEFKSVFFANTVSLGGEVQKICRHFYRYFNKFNYDVPKFGYYIPQ